MSDPPSGALTQAAGADPPPVVLEELSFAVDATSGHLFVTSDPGPIQPRDYAGHLIPSDDTQLPAARIVRTPDHILIL